mgnify:CR=1 FL=1
MTVLKKEFTKTHLDNCEFIKNQVYNNFNISPSNNTYLLLDKIQQLKNTEGAYVECGTFEGNTLLPVASYCQQFYINKEIYGMDSFEGFPISEHHINDLPERFNDLYQNNLISLDHLEKAKARTQNFKSLDHLEGEYFEQINNIFKNTEQFSNVTLVKGIFSDTTPNFNKKISLLHLDCDLYKSYLTCLNNLYKNIVNNGVIVFDEYYSHKYPGARIAIEEFFKDKKGYFEYYVTQEGHERWCFTKQEN